LLSGSGPTPNVPTSTLLAPASLSIVLALSASSLTGSGSEVDALTDRDWDGGCAWKSNDDMGTWQVAV
jgi:hypothetical protein